MPHNSQHSRKNAEAVARHSRLRAAGARGILTGDEAWHLSGGVRGTRGGDVRNVPLAKIAREVPDCEHFLPDYQTARTL